MLRRVLIPLLVLVVVGSVGTMCTALSGASARRRLQRAQRPTGIVELPAPVPVDSTPAPRLARDTSDACPASLPDVGHWERIRPAGADIEIPIPPGFENFSETRVEGAESPFLIMRALNGDEFRLTRLRRPYYGREIPQYEAASSCRVYYQDRVEMGFLFVDIETGRDTWRPGDLKVVVASYMVGSNNYIAFHGVAETAERKQQMLAAVHNARFLGR